jgi:hypothetical protein
MIVFVDVVVVVVSPRPEAMRTLVINPSVVG